MGKRKNLEVEQSIMEYLSTNQKILMKDAVKMFQLSESTLRRIFIKLEDEKKAVRTIGGIISASPDSYYNYDLTSQKQKEEKDSIGRYAARLIQPSDFIYIDCGSTTAYLAHAVVKLIQSGKLSEKLNVITNSLINLKILHPYCNVILTGGILNEKRKSFTGALGTDFLSNFHFSKGFFGADGMSFEHGFSCDNIAISQITRAALLQTNEPYVLLDSSKINHPSYVNFASLDEVSAVITDRKISKTDADAFTHCRPMLHITD